MIYKVPKVDPGAPVIVVDVGNTTTTLAIWHESTLKSPTPVATAADADFSDAYDTLVAGMANQTPSAIAVASVVPTATQQICDLLEDRFDKNLLVIGDTVPYPMDIDVDDASSVGADRVCAAAAAYETIQTGCTVVDFGTAVTVDLVSDEGSLLGGAILPGLELQLKSLNDHTAALPLAKPDFPEMVYGKNTIEAIQTGVCRGLAGAVRALVEAYASHLNSWPQVVATGGDAALMAPHCDFFDTVVEHLTLRGIGLAYGRHIGAFAG